MRVDPLENGALRQVVCLDVVVNELGMRPWLNVAQWLQLANQLLQVQQHQRPTLRRTLAARGAVAEQIP